MKNLKFDLKRFCLRNENVRTFAIKSNRTALGEYCESFCFTGCMKNEEIYLEWNKGKKIIRNKCVPAMI